MSQPLGTPELHEMGARFVGRTAGGREVWVVILEYQRKDHDAPQKSIKGYHASLDNSYYDVGGWTQVVDWIPELKEKPGQSKAVTHERRRKLLFEWDEEDKRQKEEEDGDSSDENPTKTQKAAPVEGGTGGATVLTSTARINNSKGRHRAALRAGQALRKRRDVDRSNQNIALLKASQNTSSDPESGEIDLDYPSSPPNIPSKHKPKEVGMATAWNYDKEYYLFNEDRIRAEKKAAEKAERKAEQEARNLECIAEYERGETNPRYVYDVFEAFRSQGRIIPFDVLHSALLKAQAHGTVPFMTELFRKWDSSWIMKGGLPARRFKNARQVEDELIWEKQYADAHGRPWRVDDPVRQVGEVGGREIGDWIRREVREGEETGSPLQTPKADTKKLSTPKRAGRSQGARDGPSEQGEIDSFGLPEEEMGNEDEMGENEMGEGEEMEKEDEDMNDEDEDEDEDMAE